MPTGWTIFDGWDQATRDLLRRQMQHAADVAAFPRPVTDEEAQAAVRADDLHAHTPKEGATP